MTTLINYPFNILDETVFNGADEKCWCFQAQRNNEDVDSIKPLFSVNVDHRVSMLASLHWRQLPIPPHRISLLLLVYFLWLVSLCSLTNICMNCRVHGVVPGCPRRSWLLWLALWSTTWPTAPKVLSKLEMRRKVHFPPYWSHWSSGIPHSAILICRV